MSGTGGTTTSSMNGSGSSGTGVLPPDHVSTCQGKVYACGDLVDNDMDGLIDSQDPDCLGPCDNTEDSYFGGIPGQAGPGCKVDCYFDQDSGAGNDDCNWDHKCDPYEVAPNYYPESNNGSMCAYAGPTYKVTANATCADLDTAQSAACHDYCGPLTPNGCDCFGCCELPAGKGKYVWLGSESAGGLCDIAHVDDPSRCQPCTPVADCLNGCDPCEICIGKPAPDPGCGGTTTSTTSSTGAFMTGSSSSGGGGQCLPDVQPCGLPGQAACPVGFFCNTGCCTEEPK
ncbi:MAG: hypothetical protein U0414_14475 [Polyangiaceae bacterium]